MSHQPLKEIQNCGSQSQASSKSSSRSTSITTTASFESNVSYGLSARNENFPSSSSEGTRPNDFLQSFYASSIELLQRAESQAHDEEEPDAALGGSDGGQLPESDRNEAPVKEEELSLVSEATDELARNNWDSNQQNKREAAVHSLVPTSSDYSLFETTALTDTPAADKPENSSRDGETDDGEPDTQAQIAPEDEAGSSVVVLLGNECNPSEFVEAFLAASSGATGASAEGPAANPAESTIQQQQPNLTVYKCQVCDHQNRKRKRFEDHLVVKHGVPPSPRSFCHDCNVQFLTHGQYDAHRLRNHRSGVSRCPFCCKVYVRHEYFVQHINMHVNEATCHDCKHVYCSPTSFRMHQTSRKHQLNVANNAVGGFDARFPQLFQFLF